MSDVRSIIVPIYNSEKYLKECMDSILSQTYPDMEVLLVDDGSPDNCPQICDEYAAKDSRIRVIHQKNGGAANAKNAGLRIASGEFLAFADSDDWVEPDAYGYMLEQLQKYEADVVQCGFRNVYADHTQDFVTLSAFQMFHTEEYLLRYTTDWTCGLLWDKLYRRELFKGVFFEEGHKIDDEFFTYRGIMNAGKILYDPKIVYNYRQRRSGVTLSATNGNRIVMDKLCYLPVRRELVTARFPGVKRAFDLHYLNMLLLLAKDPFATAESLRREKKLIGAYFREKNTTRPPASWLPGLCKLWLLPVNKLLQYRGKLPEEKTEHYFK